jgi:hypothetical protein
VLKEDQCEDFLNFRGVAKNLDLNCSTLGGIMFNYDAILRFLNQMPLKQQT